MPEVTYEMAKKVVSAIESEVNGDSIDDFFDWRDVDPDEYYAVMHFIRDAVESLKGE